MQRFTFISSRNWFFWVDKKQLLSNFFVKWATFGQLLKIFGQLLRDIRATSVKAYYQRTTGGVPDVPVDLANADLTDSQKAKLHGLINEYRDIFALSPQELGRTNLVQHHINTGDHPPIRQRAYRVPEAQKRRIGHFHDDDIWLQLPEFISVLLSYSNLSIPLRIKEQ